MKFNTNFHSNNLLFLGQELALDGVVWEEEEATGAKALTICNGPSKSNRKIAPRTIKAIWYECTEPLLICPKPYMMRLPTISTQPTFENQTEGFIRGFG